MKTQILVTVEFEAEAIRRTLGPVLAPPHPQMILDDLNRELRCWEASNPYSLQDREHLRLTLALADVAPNNPRLVPDIERRALANDLGRIADDLHALRRCVSLQD